ncbi:MAG: hypothetical protein NTV73_06145 [Hyphomicrobiales bacterium]|nr:hypothetical protein [Hyphomicrobiales bacterium]
MRISIHFAAVPIALIAGGAVASGLPPASSKPQQTFEERNQYKRPYDCHRDVRTHRIGGVMVTHRHVGDHCQVRVVNKLNSF